MSFNITPVASGYQEIHPCSAMNIDSVKINTSLIKMKECWYEVCAMVKICVLSQISVSSWFLSNMNECFPAILWTKSFCEDYNAIAGYQDSHKRNTERKLIVCRLIFYIYKGLLGLRPLDPSARLAWITSSFPLRERSSLPTQSVTYGQTDSLRTSLLDVKTA